MVRTRRIPALALALACLPALVAGCGGEGGSRADLERSARRVETVLGTVSRVLPAIPIEIGKDGRVARIASFPASSVNDFFEDLTGTPLVGRIVFFSHDYLEWFDSVDLQHLTIATRPEGLFVMANGRPLPHIAWNATTLDNLVEVIGRFQSDGSEAFSLMSPDTYEALGLLLPIASRVELRFDLRFPDLAGVGPDDRREIPLPPPGAIDAMVDARSSGETPLETVDVALSFEPYSENGVELGWVPAVFGFSTVDLQRLVKGLELDPEGKLEIPRLVLREDLRERIAREKIQTVAAEMRDDGLYARVDGALLPHLAWSEESLVNLSDLLMRLYPGDEDGLPDDAAWVPLVRATAPMYNDYDLALQFAFPGG